MGNHIPQMYPGEVGSPGSLDPACSDDPPDTQRNHRAWAVHRSSVSSVEMDDNESVFPLPMPFYRRAQYPKHPFVTDLGKLRELQNPERGHSSVEPAVIWTAKIYEHGRTHVSDLDELNRPAMKYIDDRPIQLSIGVHPSQLSMEIKKTVPGNLEWSGPVMAIEVFVEAEFPLAATDWPSLDMLNPKRVSMRHLVTTSPFLIQALNEIVDHYPSFHEELANEHSGRELRIHEPFAVLFHHYDSIQEVAAVAICKDEHDEKAQRTKEHMQHLVNFLRPIYQESILPCLSHISGSVPRVAFDTLWYLLRPGTDVYVQADGSAYTAVVIRVISSSFDHVKRWDFGSPELWEVALWRLMTDGSRLWRRLVTVKVYAYSGLKDVTSLPVCPASIWDKQDDGERRKQILLRSTTLFKALQRGNLLADYKGPIMKKNEYYAGKIVIDHRRGIADPLHREFSFVPRAGNGSTAHNFIDYSDRFQDYNGLIINNDQPFDPDQDHRKRHTAAKSDNSSINPEPSFMHFSFPDRDGLDNELAAPVVQELSEHQLLLLCPETLAYALSPKKWIRIHLDYVKESKPSDESISNLVIERDELRTIKALSNRQNSKAQHWSADFIRGKGSGQIILLHGPPGVGKTYTVEAIAEWLHRPLLALTVADIGTVETLVERELIKWFSLAEAWNAVLLVDEADIFLERRQNRDLARNGLVSAFLRRMEYFKGLIFLTTNRVGQIDDAFISLVHVAIGYQPLDAETRRKVWNGFFRKLVHDRAGKIQIAPDAKKWILDTTGETELNGRDIRNALQTAITLAEFDSEEDPDYDASLVTIVTKAHFQKVLEMGNRFRKYVTSIRREDEQKRAQGRGDRNDYDCELVNEMAGL